MKNYTIKEYSYNLFQDNKEELLHRIGILNYDVEDIDIKILLEEIVTDFSHKNEILASSKIILFMKMAINNFEFYSEKMHNIDIEDCKSMMDMSLSLMNAAAIYNSPALQSIIHAGESDDK